MSMLLTASPPARRERSARAARRRPGHRRTAAPGLAPLGARPRPSSPAEHPPSHAFRAGCGTRLVTEAAARGPHPPHRPTRRARARPGCASRCDRGGRLGRGGRRRGRGEPRALPGDALYGLKRQIESASSPWPAPTSRRGRELLEQADDRLPRPRR